MKHELTLSSGHVDAVQHPTGCARAPARAGHWRRMWLSVCIALSLSACSASRGEQSLADRAPAPLTHQQDTLARDKEPRAPNPEHLALGMATAGYDVLKALADKDQNANVLVSPTSLGMAFALLGEGAEGDTRSGLMEALGLPHGAGFGALGALGETLTAPMDGVAMSLANGIWAAQGLPMKPPFKDSASKNFGAELASVDFQKPETRVSINRWFETATQGRIPEMFADLPTDTRIVLGNALHFKATWATPFDPAKTQEGAFAAPTGAVQVPMMSHSFSRLSHMDETAWSAIKLPFSGGHHELIIVLPKEGQSAGENLPCTGCAGEPPRWTRPSGWAATRVEVTLPRFSVSSGGDVTDTVRETRLGAALKPDADFSGISEEAIQIDQVVHRVSFSVDEQGAEAAAATGLIGTRSMQSEPVVFRVDRPFLAVIRHVPTDTILVAGLIRNPTAP